LSREGHDEDDPMSTDNSRRRKTTKVGGSFYLAPLMSVTEKNFSFMTEAVCVGMRIGVHLAGVL